ncbi:MAG: glycine/sarcosine/betaine reductase complex component C subunit alpha [Sedimentibacter sp.]|uniref:glycine/sarcosine/betaine reductase complex component C subunit alpha n=1 Tax=Sedimentibacter sp. TaxID=1960295 RepID=UPI00315867CF
MQEKKQIRKLISDSLLEVADAIESGQYKEKVRIGITTLGSEHGIENLVKGAELAARNNKDIQVVLLGPKVDTKLEVVEVNSEEELHKTMEKLLDEKYIQACVTNHYNFPIGVSTVGRVVTPGLGNEMFIATTTGTSSTHRGEAMMKNALYGIITAKCMGVSNPTVGVLNLDGARQVERALKELASNGYPIQFAESMRADGGSVMRGNDLLCGSADVMVMDTLTGNILMKVFSSYTTGGSYEAMGYGYGPGVGENFERIILIISRASGVPVVANAISYAASLARGGLADIGREELKKAKAAGLEKILQSLSKDSQKTNETSVNVLMPDKEVVTGQISGIEIMDLEDAVKSLWQAGIYAESGMGCTGPIVLVNDTRVEKAAAVLGKAGFITQ